VPHSASGPLTLCLALDKRRAKETFFACGIPTARWHLIDGTAARNGGPPGRGPWIVKPVHEGSSKGISARSFCTDAIQVYDYADRILADYQQAALVEEFLPGREFTVGVLGNGRAARALPIVEIAFEALPAGVPHLYGFEAKWLWDTPDATIEIFRCPADLEPALERRIADTALTAYHALGCLDWARIDIRLDADDIPNVIEVNPLPGILPNPDAHSCLPAAARQAGLAYEDLILTVLDLALERYGMTR
jgi:D-alanine-D-alanine ligase